MTAFTSLNFFKIKSLAKCGNAGISVAYNYTTPMHQSNLRAQLEEIDNDKKKKIK